ncbi:hypothetical protein MTO96_035509 [Rhipicephalus appendiculatus]
MVENPATECERSAVVLSTLSNGAVSAPVIGLGPARNVPIGAPTDWPPANLKDATRGRRYTSGTRAARNAGTGGVLFRASRAGAVTAVARN